MGVVLKLNNERHGMSIDRRNSDVAECDNCREAVNRLDLLDGLCLVCFFLLRRLRVGRMWTIADCTVADRTGAD